MGKPSRERRTAQLLLSIEIALSALRLHRARLAFFLGEERFPAAPRLLLARTHGTFDRRLCTAVAMQLVRV